MNVVQLISVPKLLQLSAVLVAALMDVPRSKLLRLVSK